MYHIELRQFPHNFCRFNMSEQELRDAILGPWSRGEWVEQGDRRWSPKEASLTIIEGPELSPDRLSMGRGWRSAQRVGTDVTARVLAPTSPVGSSAPSISVPTSLAGEVLALLGEDPGPLIRAWQLALERHPDRTPSECLALAEDLVRR